MKYILLGVLVIMMTFAANHSYAQRYVRGNVHINQGGYRADLHVFGRVPYSSCGNNYNTNYYQGGYRGNTLSGFGYCSSYPIYQQRVLVPVTVCQTVIVGQGYDQWGNLINYTSQQCWTEYR